MGLILDGTTGISASGNITGGNIIVTGSFTPTSMSVTGNVQGAYIIGNGSLLSSITAANVTGTVSSATTATSATTAGTVTTAAQPNITSVGTLNSLAVTANVTGGNLLTGGLISAAGQITGSQFNGSGAGLSSIPGANVTGTLSVNTTGYAATVSTAAQPNITSVGTLTSLSVAGFTISANTITSQGPTLTIDPNAAGGIDGNVVIQGNLVVNGNMTYINSNNITTNDLTINMANNAATATAANGGGIEVGPAGAAYITLTYNSASNIWVASNGMSVQGVVQTAGNITGGNVLTGGQVSATGNVYGVSHLGTTVSMSGNITGGNVIYGSGQVSGTGSVYATAFVGSLTGTATSAVSATTAATVTTAAQPNITSVGTLSSLTVTANISGGNILYGAGVMSGTGSVYATAFVGSLTGTATSAVSATSAGTATSATTAATVTTAAQPNITSVGTLGSVYVSGAISVGGGIVNTAGNGVSNIGATGAYFNTVFAKATSAQYADLAEMYAADSGYAPGTVVAFGGTQEVTLSTTPGDRRVAGVISTNPSYLMNSTLSTPYAVPVALTGRVPTQVTGEVRKGDLMVSNGDGTARADADPQVGAVIGKALADFTGDKGTIEIVVGRL